jgi:NADPH-dependent glutamate synthase beta subunit-like oxidoreductase/ferredoxin
MPTSGDRGHSAGGARAPGRAGESALAEVLQRPRQEEKTPPCAAGCATGADVRGWIGIIAQRHKLGLTEHEAYARAWRLVTEVNPFPATLGRICPHPCESGCNRAGKDGAVAINALERFLGDWGLQQRLGLPTLEESPQPESIGVIGAGPAGLSFAYQMARRGYRVTVYEKHDKPGGMLHHGIPQFRLPEDVLDAEIRRVLDLGVDLKLGTTIGRDVSVQELRDRHAALFFGIGAGRGLRLGIPGEDGAGVWSGTQYLEAVNRGEQVPLGERVVVVGGGNTAIDAARSARRTGARVTLMYRRSPAEMPAIRSEVEGAAEEGVDLLYLAAPVRIERNAGGVRAVTAQRMQLAEADASGRRRCVPLEGSEFEVPADAVIAAVSQEADWSDLDGLGLEDSPRRTRDGGSLGSGLWAGGDALGAGIAGLAIASGRKAAEAVHAQLRGLPAAVPAASGVAVPAASVKADYYAAKDRASVPSLPVAARLAQPDAEVEQTLREEAFLGEVTRCFSCGQCFGCEHCFTYCNAGGFTRVEQPQPGAYFALSLDSCEACRKCIEVCPCGFLGASPRTPPGAPG